MPGETALVTGAGRGIGRATAEAFREEGWTVYATAREAGDLDGLEADGFEAVELDVTDGAACVAAVERVVEEQGRLDCLVNNAGYGQLGAAEDLQPHRLHRQFETNLYGPHRLIRAALPHMRKAESGRIVNVSSVAATLGVPGLGAYAASKAALERFTDSLRREVGEFGIEVVLVRPGPVETDFEEQVAASADGLDRSGAYDYIYDAYEDRSLLADLGASSPEAVAGVILDAATCADPAPRMPVGPAGRIAGYLEFVPDRWQDSVSALASRLVR